MNKTIQAKHISDRELLIAIRSAQRKQQQRSEYWASLPLDTVWSVTGDIEEELPYPPKVIRAKLASAVKRKLIDGCTCGCRGDFYPLEAGLALLDK